MATLYRKYRPQNFKEVVGQNHIKLTLSHEVEADKLAHAYLFCGPRAVGKTTLARVLAKAINCTNRKEGEHDPCNKCESCQNITVGKNLDIIEIDAASHTGVDNVRDNIISSARVAPSNSKYKVFIIDEVHMLSISAFNALLKTLEEPPANVIFILCTTETHKVPTTIISRCQRFDFKRISVVDVINKLKYIIKSEGIKIDIKILESIARQSEGHMRDAESLLGQIVSIGGKEITAEEADLVIPRSDIAEAINLVEALSKKDASLGLEIVNKLINEGVDLKVFIKDLIELLRKMLFTKLSPALSEKLGMELGESLEIKINEIGKSLEVNNLLIFIEEFNKARGELKGSFVPQMPIELAVIRICVGALAPVSSKPIVNTTPPSPTPPSIRPKVTPSAPPSPQAPIVSPPVNNINTSSNIKSEEILSKWNEVLIKIKKYNHSLSFILRVCEPRDLTGNQLCLAFKYKFHKDRVSDINIKQIIEKVLAEVYGEPLLIESIVDESIVVEIPPTQEAPSVSNIEEPQLPVEESVAPKEEVKEQGDMMNNLLKTFGGKIVD